MDSNATNHVREKLDVFGLSNVCLAMASSDVRNGASDLEDWSTGSSVSTSLARTRDIWTF